MQHTTHYSSSATHYSLLTTRYLFVTLYSLLSTLILFSCDFSDKSNTTTDEPLTIQGTPAIVDVSQRIEQDPDNAELYALRGKLFYEEEQYVAAVSDLGSAIQLDSMNLSYYHALADAYFDSNQSKPALAILEKVLQKDSTRINTMLKLAEMQMIVRQHEASLSTVQKILAQKPRHPEGFYVAGLNFEHTGDTARAISSFQTTVEEDPDHIDAYRKLGAHFDKRNNKLALKYLDNALRIDSTDREALVSKAWYYHQRNRFAEAKKYYEKGSSFHPFDAQIHLNNGILHLEMKDGETAYDKFNIAVEVDPQYGIAYYYRAFAAERAGKGIKNTIKDYQQAAALMPDPQRALEALSRLGAE